jgi:hypothetical protein
VVLLEKAEGYILNYCGIDARPAALDGVALELAVIYYNRMGIEGNRAAAKAAYRAACSLGISHRA